MILGDNMTKEDYWILFKKTGKIIYYLKYKNIMLEDDINGKKN